MRPNLTINFGLRYERQAGWHEVANRFGGFDPTLQNPLSGTLGAVFFGQSGSRHSLMDGVNVLAAARGLCLGAPSQVVGAGGFGIYSLPWSIDTYSGGEMGFGTMSSGLHFQYRPDHSAVLRAESQPAHFHPERMRTRDGLLRAGVARSGRIQRPKRELHSRATFRLARITSGTSASNGNWAQAWSWKPPMWATMVPGCRTR